MNTTSMHLCISSLLTAK